MDLSASEREERGHGEGRDMYATLRQSDTESEERGEGGGVYATLRQSDTVTIAIWSRKSRYEA